MVYRVNQFNFYTSDNIRLFAKVWLPKNFEYEKIIIFHHGLGEHCDRYENLINFFEDLNFTFFSYDIRGHGRSGGIRGDVESILRLVLDLEEFIYFVKQEYKIEKPLLLGHSLGGLITSYFTLRHTNQEEIKALILSAPALEISLNPLQRIKYYIGKLLYYIKPDLILKSEINPDDLSHDKNIVEKYKNDPLVHPYISVRTGIDLIESIKFVHHHANKIKIPVWIGHGTHDKITSYLGSEKFFRKIKSFNKELKLYHGLYHEIFNESTKISLQDLKNWVFELLNKNQNTHPF
jgi:lysophospholipase